MIKLEETFVSGEGGYSAAPLTYRQVVRKDRIAVYQRFYKDGTPKDFEVIVIRIIPKGTKIFNAPPTPDDEERYAATSSWGRCGWGYPGKDKAMQKYKELCEKSVVPDEESDSVSEADSVKEPAETIPGSPDDFSTNDYAAKRGIAYVDAYLLIKTGLLNKTIVFVREERRHAKGKPSRIYRQVT